MQSWARRAKSNNFCAIPAPFDPFALPVARNSDPIRGPIFVELNTEPRKDATAGENGAEESIADGEAPLDTVARGGRAAPPDMPPAAELPFEFRERRMPSRQVSKALLLVNTWISLTRQE